MSQAHCDAWHGSISEPKLIQYHCAAAAFWKVSICVQSLYLRELKLLPVVEGTYTAMEPKLTWKPAFIAGKINQQRNRVSETFPRQPGIIPIPSTCEGARWNHRPAAGRQNEQMSLVRDGLDKTKEGEKNPGNWNDLVVINKSIPGQANNIQPVSFCTSMVKNLPPQTGAYRLSYLGIPLVHRPFSTPSPTPDLWTFEQKPENKTLDLWGLGHQSQDYFVWFSPGLSSLIWK